jgi:hypothetical protein
VPNATGVFHASGVFHHAPKVHSYEERSVEEMLLKKAVAVVEVSYKNCG